MEQLQEEVPEVREEEEEEEEAVMVAGGASDTSGGPDSSLPSSSYTGEWSPGSIQASTCSAARAEDLPLDGVWWLVFNLSPLRKDASRASLGRGLVLSVQSLHSH